MMHFRWRDWFTKSFKAYAISRRKDVQSELRQFIHELYAAGIPTVLMEKCPDQYWLHDHFRFTHEEDGDADDDQTGIVEELCKFRAKVRQ